MSRAVRYVCQGGGGGLLRPLPPLSRNLFYIVWYTTIQLFLMVCCIIFAQIQLTNTSLVAGDFKVELPDTEMAKDIAITPDSGAIQPGGMSILQVQ